MIVRRTQGAEKLVRIGMIAATLLCSRRLAWGDSIDNARLLVTRQDAKNWLLPGHDYTNQRYVALEQINTQNVKSLALRWKFPTGIREAFQTTPLVADGVMYITTPRNHLVALDARTGTQVWRYEHPRSTPQTSVVVRQTAVQGWGMERSTWRPRMRVFSLSIRRPGNLSGRSLLPPRQKEKRRPPTCCPPPTRSGTQR